MEEAEKMKGIICYYSGSGNTKLACEYIAGNMRNIDFEFHNIVKDGMPDLNNYSLVGFACFADHWGPSFLVEKFLKKLPLEADTRHIYLVCRHFYISIFHIVPQDQIFSIVQVF